MKKILNARTIALIGVLSAIAGVLSVLDFPLPFIAPSFLKFNFSEIPVLIGAFAMGPVAGVIIEVIKILINLLLNGTTTAYVGEAANLSIAICYILPASIIYHYNKTKKGAYIGLVVGTIFTTVIACVLNAYVILPVYANVYGTNVEAFVGMGSKIFSGVDSVFTLLAFCIGPFNLIKGIVTSIIVALIYKKASFVIKGFRNKGN